jgi:hypothetical protein
MRRVSEGEVKKAVAAAGGRAVDAKTAFALAGPRLFQRIGGEWYEHDKERS